MVSSPPRYPHRTRHTAQLLAQLWVINSPASHGERREKLREDFDANRSRSQNQGNLLFELRRALALFKDTDIAARRITIVGRIAL